MGRRHPVKCPRKVVRPVKFRSEHSVIEHVESLTLMQIERAHTSPSGVEAAEPCPPSSVEYLTPAERAMLERARAGEHRALREFYGTYHQQVRAHLYRLLGSDSEIDDLVQTVFARAFAALDMFKANATISTWLYRITANTTHNVLRQRFRRERVKSALQWFNAGRGTNLSGCKLEARDEAHRVLQRLRPDLREVFVLYHYEGLTLQEIGEILDKPVSTIGDRLTRARGRLRELIGN